MPAGRLNFWVPMFYKVEFSVVGQKFVLEEVYLGFKHVPIVQNVIFGNQQPPMALLHLGFCASFIVGGGESSLRFRARPESHLAPFLVDTKSIETDTAFTFAPRRRWCAVRCRSRPNISAPP